MKKPVNPLTDVHFIQHTLSGDLSLSTATALLTLSPLERDSLAPASETTAPFSLGSALRTSRLSRFLIAGVKRPPRA
jgi:hypothetical protein